MSLVTKLRNRYHSVLKRAGETGYLLQTTSTVNPITGAASVVTAKHAALMFLGKIGVKEEYGVDFDFDEQRCYTSAKDLVAAGVVPDKDDKVIVAGKTWAVTWVHTYRVNGLPTCYMLKVRK